MCSTNCAKLRSLTQLCFSPCGLSGSDKLTTQLTETSPQCTASELRLQPRGGGLEISSPRKQALQAEAQGRVRGGKEDKRTKKAKNIDSMRCDSIRFDCCGSPVWFVVVVVVDGQMGVREKGLGCLWLLQVSRRLYIYCFISSASVLASSFLKCSSSSI